MAKCEKLLITGQTKDLGRHITIHLGEISLEEFKEVVKKVKRIVKFNK